MPSENNKPAIDMHTRTEFNHCFRDGSIDLQEYDKCGLEDFMNGAIRLDEIFNFLDQAQKSKHERLNIKTSVFRFTRKLIM